MGYVLSSGRVLFVVNKNAFGDAHKGWAMKDLPPTQ